MSTPIRTRIADALVDVGWWLLALAVRIDPPIAHAPGCSGGTYRPVTVDCPACAAAMSRGGGCSSYTRAS